MENIQFGLIGRNISYSFSQKYFEQKFKKLFLENHHYSLFDIENIDGAKSILNQKNLKGLNVTIPYKKEIIPLLSEMDEVAGKIQAVNCIKLENGISKGYNTDIYGFEKTLNLSKKSHSKALILGNGGASSAVKFILEKNDIQYEIVSRKSEINFENLPEDLVAESTLIVQTTPVGTFPDVENSVKFPFHCLGKNHFVIDLIYNPEMTKFLKNSAENGAQTSNGLFMLEQQAEKAWQIWNS